PMMSKKIHAQHMRSTTLALGILAIALAGTVALRFSWMKKDVTPPELASSAAPTVESIDARPTDDSIVIAPNSTPSSLPVVIMPKMQSTARSDAAQPHDTSITDNQNASTQTINNNNFDLPLSSIQY